VIVVDIAGHHLNYHKDFCAKDFFRAGKFLSFKTGPGLHCVVSQLVLHAFNVHVAERARGAAVKWPTAVKANQRVAPWALSKPVIGKQSCRFFATYAQVELKLSLCIVVVFVSF
jgi:hypothetical protein